MNRETKIVASFPGTGKSWIDKNTDLLVLDCDSSAYSKKINGDVNPSFPENYISMICKNIGKYDYILISCHKEVREALEKKGFAYSIVKPHKSLLIHYRERYIERGSTNGFIFFMSQKWDVFLDELASDNAALKNVTLYRNEYLNDCINTI